MTTAERKELGLLILVILKAQHLPDPHKFSKQDPFVIAQLGDEHFRTQTDRGGGQVPLWDEEFRLKLYDEEGRIEGQKLTLKVMRKEGVRAKDEELIGEGHVMVDGKSWIEFDEWIDLKNPEGKWVGQVYVEMTFYPLEAQNPTKTNLTRHPTKLDSSTRTPVPPSLQPGYGGGLAHTFSTLAVDDQAATKELPPTPAPPLGVAGRLPFPGDPDHSDTLPDSLRPATSLQRPASASKGPTLPHHALPLPAEQYHPPAFEQQQSLRPTLYQHSLPPTMPPHRSPPFGNSQADPSFALSSSPGQYSYLSPSQTHQPSRSHPASYPSFNNGATAVDPALGPATSPKPHSTSYPPSHTTSAPASSSPLHQHPATSPAIPPRPSSAASSITETMPGGWEPSSHSTLSSSYDRLTAYPPPPPPIPPRRNPSSEGNVPVPPPRRYPPSPSPSPSTSSLPSRTTLRPPLPPNPSGISTPSSSPRFDSKDQEAAIARAHALVHGQDRDVPPPPAYPVPSRPDRSPDRQRPQVFQGSDVREREPPGEEGEAARTRARQEREGEREREREEEVWQRAERERVAEAAKLERIRLAQEARAKRLEQERQDEQVAIEQHEREREAERSRRERERLADEAFVERLQQEERDRVLERERRDEELARTLRAEEEAERVKRERDDEEYVRRLRDEEERVEEEERQRRLVEDERLARSLAERENEANERRR